MMYRPADGHGNVDELNNDEHFDGHAAREDNNANDSTTDGLIMRFFATITFLTV
jgi:hypothetical protein